MANHSRRGRIEVRPLGTSNYTRIPALLKGWHIPEGWQLVAEVRHPVNQEDGLLIRHKQHGALGMLAARVGGVFFLSIDHRKAEAALAAMKAQQGQAQ